VSAARERLGEKLTLLMSSWSPPASLKADGQRVCSGNTATCTLAQLDDGSFDYEGFATYWLDSLQAYADLGVEPDYIGIQNDPDYVPPAADANEACRFLPSEGTTTVSAPGGEMEVDYPGFEEALAAVRAALSNLPSAPQILGPETVGVIGTVNYLMDLDLDGIDVLAHHMYGWEEGDEADREASLTIGEIGAENDLPIFQTEMMSDGLGTAILIHEALVTIGASAYLQNDFVGSAMLNNPDTTALIALSDNEFELADPYHAMGHFARDTDPGWVRVDTSVSEGNVLSTAWLSPEEDALTVVLVNPSVTEVVVELAFEEDTPSNSTVTRTVFPGTERSAELGELGADNSVTLPGESIVTVAARF
jgi:O-glycosyl hydrolase